VAIVTKSIGSGKDYASTAAWEAASYGATASDDAVGQVYGEVSGVVVLSDSTPLTITLEGEPSGRHNGQEGSGARLTYTTFGYLVTLDMGVPTTIQWLEFKGNDTDNQGGITCTTNADPSGGNHVLDHCIFYDLAGARGAFVAGVIDAGTINVYRCGAWNLGGDGFSAPRSGASEATINIYNCTIYSAGDEGITLWSGFDGTVENCSVTDCTTDNISTANHTETNNYETDGQAANNYVDSANGDFRLKDTSSALYSAGNDLGTSPTGIDTDIQGGVVHGNDWDQGAFQLERPVYYSIRPAGTGDLSTGTSPQLTISNGVATIDEAQTGDIGVGMEVTYDTSKKAYIEEFTSTTSLKLRTATGGLPDAEGSLVDLNSIAAVWSALTTAETSWTGSSYLNDTDITATGANVVLNVACYGSTVDGSSANINGTTTDATHYIRIFTPTGGTESANNHRHPGYWDTGYYRLDTTTYPFGIWDAAVRAEGLQISATNGDIARIQASTLEDARISYCVLEGHSNASLSCVHMVTGDAASAAVVYLYNNVAHGMDNATDGTGFYFQYSGNITAYIYNNTIVDCDRGIAWSGTGTEEMVNNLVDATDAFWGTFDSGQNDYNFSSQNTNDSGALGANGDFNVTFAYRDSGGSPPDYHLSESDTGAQGQGLSDPGEGLFSDDIDGVERTGTWDVGMDQFGRGQNVLLGLGGVPYVRGQRSVVGRSW
jgi:hypothetical protein